MACCALLGGRLVPHGDPVTILMRDPDMVLRVMGNRQLSLW
jgi:hypothetical protein